ncbi:MAG: hypothetical protein OEV26_04470 [Gallionella sp.]|nr:hypothetical protein [Gallionella sp.]
MKYLNKTSGTIRLASLLFGAALLGSVSQNALALTAPGTTISNTATLTYSVGAVAQAPITTIATSFVVDAKIDVLVSGGGIVTVTPSVISKVIPFTVTNLGNTRQNFALTANNASNGVVALAVTDNYDTSPSPQTVIYSDTGVIGVIDGTDAPITSIVDLDPGVSANLLVRADFTLANTNGQIAVISLKATTLWPTTLIPAEEPAAGVGAGQMGGAGVAVTATIGADTAGIDVVFADIAGVAADATAQPAAVTADIARDGAHSTYGAFSVSSAALSVSKVATVICDPLNGNVNPKYIPGAAVQYAVTITNAVGAASATLTQVTDALNAALAFDPKLNSGALPATNCVSGNVANTLAASGFGAVSGAGVVTSYAAPGVAGEATTAGATATPGPGGTVTINFATLISPTYTLVGGVLPADSFVTVYFNAFVQ